MKSLLATPLSHWSLKKLRAISIDSADMHCQRRQGCYLLVASGTENDKQIVELYVGSSENMALRYQRHVNLIEKCGARMQHFHWRCLQLNDTTPLFIPLSYDSTCDNDTLRPRIYAHRSRRLVGPHMEREEHTARSLEHCAEHEATWKGGETLGGLAWRESRDSVSYPCMVLQYTAC